MLVRRTQPYFVYFEGYSRVSGEYPIGTLGITDGEFMIPPDPFFLGAYRVSFKGHTGSVLSEGWDIERCEQVHCPVAEASFRRFLGLEVPNVRTS